MKPDSVARFAIKQMLNKLDMLQGTHTTSAFRQSDTAAVSFMELREILESGLVPPEAESKSCQHRWGKSNKSGMEWCVDCGEFKPDSKKDTIAIDKVLAKRWSELATPRRSANLKAEILEALSEGSAK